MEVYNFRKGSVVFDLTAYFKASTNATDHKLTEVMKAGTADSNFTIIEIELIQSYPCIQVCATKDQPKSKTWIFVSIGCGVVILVLLVIILFLVVSSSFWLSLADSELGASLQKCYGSLTEMSHAINSNF